VTEPLSPLRAPLSRRGLLQAGGTAALGAAAVGGGIGWRTAVARAAALRAPNSLPRPGEPAGEVDPTLPFDHVVIVMQENHSFDSYLGMLPHRGQPRADGLTFDGRGVPINSNPYKGGFVTIQHAPSDCTLEGSGGQSWTSTHRQINGGRMDGFAAVGIDSMAYWDEADLPFYYSLARTFCVGDRWFCSAPCQTYPNRRFLMAGTASGIIATDTSNVMVKPANGTIFDRLHQYGVSWANYFSQVPTSAIIFETVQKYPANMVPIARFFADCAAGTLPAVSMVDSGIGAVDVLASAVGADNPTLLPAGARPANMDEDEESGNISEGENFVYRVVEAVLRSPLWPRVLLIWLYDEHGGNYDHVAPPRAIPPDNIPPMLSPSMPRGGYDMYGPRVPSVVVSGYARPNAVSSVVHDHTSIMATIEAKWNLPACTYRDANATTLTDFLVPVGASPSFPEPPALALPSNEGKTQADCDPGPLRYPVAAAAPSRGGPRPRRAVSFELQAVSLHARSGRVVLELRSVGRTLHGVSVEVRQHGRVLAHVQVGTVGETAHRVVIHARGLKRGRCRIEALAGRRAVAVHSERVVA
jgi:phospholipase C